MKAPTDLENRKTDLQQEQRSRAKPHLPSVEEPAGLVPNVAKAITGENNPLAVSLVILAIVAIVYALHAGKEMALPLTLAIVLKLLFQPTVDFLCNWLHLPQIIGALAW
jgi:hypothetical protein